MGWLLLLSVSAWKSPTGVELLILQKSSLRWNFAACRRLALRGPWLPHCRLEHLKELRSQVLRSRQRVQYGSGEKRGLFGVVAGKLSSESVDQGCWFPECEFLYIKAAESGDRMLSSSQVEVFPCSINTKAKLYQIGPISRKCPVKHQGMALTMNPEGAPFYI